MQIAKEFDDQEKKLMAEMGTETKEFLTYMAEDSGNVADDGNYSVQVLAKALEVFHLSCVPMLNPEAKQSKQSPHQETAFICNLKQHWLTVRKVQGHWFNINSLLKNPEPLSDFYLSAFLDTLISRGYTVFVIKGELPAVNIDKHVHKDSNWKRAIVDDKQEKNNKMNTSMDKDLEEALMQSELDAAIQMSLSSQSQSQSQPIETTSTPSNSQISSKVEVVEIIDDEDLELQKAIAFSKQVMEDHEKQKKQKIIEQEPEKGENVVELAFRLPDGSRISRRFLKTTTFQTINDFLRSKDVKVEHYDLISTNPKKEYNEPSKTIEETGLFANPVVIFLKSKSVTLS